ncbi:MAG: RNA polymerase sigma factor [Micromonosporaceae bacterium]
MRSASDRGGNGRAADVGALGPWGPGQPPARDPSAGAASGASHARPLSADASDLSAALRGAQNGDEEAFGMLYQAVQPGLLRYLRVQVGNAAEDVASETWLQIARDLASFRGDSGGFRGWAVTIARHRAMDYLRHQRRLPATGGSVDDLADVPAGDDTAGAALDGLATDAALELIARLPRDQAEAVLLRVVMGLDVKTAAKVAGKRAGAVRTAAYRGLRGLAELLEQARSRQGERAARDAAPTIPEATSANRVTKKADSTLKDMR